MTAVFQQKSIDLINAPQQRGSKHQPQAASAGFVQRLVGNAVLLAVLLGLVGTLWFSPLAHAKGTVDTKGMPTMAATELPKQGQETYQKIQQGGPFPHEKDGTVFGNRERILPNEKRGYYREYTVKTPGSQNRGARRIVCGGKPTTPDACYYTADHYSSFKRIAP